MTAAGMQGTSRQSLAATRETLGTLLRSGDTDVTALSEQLFWLAGLLDRELPLRRALTDTSRDGDARAGLLRSVVGDRLGDAAQDVVVWAVRGRWSAPRDLADAVELLAVEAQVAAAEQAGRLDSLEDELFRTARVVAGTPDLRVALGNRTAPVEARAALVEDLLGGKAIDETRRLVRQAVVAPRGRSFDRTLTEYGQIAADRRSRMVATVTATTPLTEQQRSRLGAVLARLYGHDVQLNVEIDPDVLGGIRVEIGDEVIDGSVVGRLEDARRRLAG